MAQDIFTDKIREYINSGLCSLLFLFVFSNFMVLKEKEKSHFSKKVACFVIVQKVNNDL